jgi:hypothetical protein
MAAAGFGKQLAEAVRSSVRGDYRRIRAGSESIREALDAEDHGLQPMPVAHPAEWHFAAASDPGVQGKPRGGLCVNRDDGAVPGCRDCLCPGDCRRLAGFRLADDR